VFGAFFVVAFSCVEITVDEFRSLTRLGSLATEEGKHEEQSRYSTVNVGNGQQENSRA